MARHSHRAQVRACDGTRLKAISERDAHRLISDGEAIGRTRNGELEIELKERRASDRTSPNITHRDMVNNAFACLERRRNSARTKVAHWPHVHDRYAVTVLVRGAVWIPNQKAAAARAAAMAR
jgi:hypothetical protein